MTFLHDVLKFLRCVEDFERLSGGQMKAKYGADPMEGYGWIAKQARVLAAKIEAEMPESKKSAGITPPGRWCRDCGGDGCIMCEGTGDAARAEGAETNQGKDAP
jgi:hypothetical protein